MIKIVWSNEGDWPIAGPPHADDCFSFSSNMYNSVKNARRREGVDAGNINRVLFGGVSYWAHVCGTSCLKLSLCELFTAATLAVNLFSWSYWWWQTHVLLAGGNIHVGVPLGNCLCWISTLRFWHLSRWIETFSGDLAWFWWKFFCCLIIYVKFSYLGVVILRSRLALVLAMRSRSLTSTLWDSPICWCLLTRLSDSYLEERSEERSASPLFTLASIRISRGMMRFWIVTCRLVSED